MTKDIVVHRNILSNNNSHHRPLEHHSNGAILLLVSNKKSIFFDDITVGVISIWLGCRTIGALKPIVSNVHHKETGKDA